MHGPPAGVDANREEHVVIDVPSLATPPQPPHTLIILDGLLHSIGGIEAGRDEKDSESL
jgi:hypothetical protein